MTMPDTTVYRSNYTPASYAIDTVALSFDLYDDHALVNNTLKLFRQHEGDLHLFGNELELLSIHMNGLKLDPTDYSIEQDGLIIKKCPDSLILHIITRIRPQDNTELSGLYRSNHLFCTQCEAEGFRRITYFLDRPDVLATYTTRISADKNQYPVLLSNGNLMESGDSDDGRHWAVWHDPFKKPSYLFALVAGNLAFIKDEFITCS